MKSSYTESNFNVHMQLLYMTGKYSHCINNCIVHEEKMTKYLKLSTVLSTVVLASCVGPLSKSPAHGMIDQKYFKCVESKNLEGGIYGKGPFKKFGPTNTSCWRSEWVEITREEFKKLATNWYGYDWSSEIPYWSN